MDWTISFSDFVKKKGGQAIIIDNINRLLRICNTSEQTVAIVYFAKNVQEVGSADELTSGDIERYDRLYFVYEQGYEGKDWLWRYEGFVSIEDL